MKRRDFIKTTAAVGIPGFLAQKCASRIKSRSGPGFDVHPFVRSHPEAVFIHPTSVSSKLDTRDIRDAGFNLAKELIVKTDSGGYPLSTKIAVKPNWTCSGPKNGKPVYEKLGINTDPNF